MYLCVPLTFSLVVRVMSAVLGVMVRTDPEHRPDGRPRLLLANHVSCLDPLALQLATSCDSVSACDSASGDVSQLSGRLCATRQEARVTGIRASDPTSKTCFRSDGV